MCIHNQLTCSLSLSLSLSLSRVVLVCCSLFDHAFHFRDTWWWNSEIWTTKGWSKSLVAELWKPLSLMTSSVRHLWMPSWKASLCLPDETNHCMHVPVVCAGRLMIKCARQPGLADAYEMFLGFEVRVCNALRVCMGPNHCLRLNHNLSSRGGGNACCCLIFPPMLRAMNSTSVRGPSWTK